MRHIVLVLLAAGGWAMVGAAPASAFGTRYPFCLQGDEFPGLSNCTFTSYRQCQATASGRILSCIANPYYNPGGARRRGGDRLQPGYPYH
jgi:hypothetical protein